MGILPLKLSNVICGLNHKLFLETSNISTYMAIPAAKHYTIKKTVWTFLKN